MLLELITSHQVAVLKDVPIYSFQLIPFNFDARFGIPKHITIHEMETAQKSS